MCFIKMHSVSGSFSLCHPHKHTEKRLLTFLFELPIYFLPSSLSSLMLRLLYLPPCVFKATATQPVNVGHRRWLWRMADSLEQSLVSLHGCAADFTLRAPVSPAIITSKKPVVNCKA